MSEQFQDQGHPDDTTAWKKANLHDIGWAIKQMWNGSRVTREGWHGKGMWLEMQRPDLGSKMNLPYVYITMPRPDGAYILVPWSCNGNDLLSVDWMVVGP